MNRRFVLLELLQEDMASLKEILAFVLLLHKFGDCLEWVPIASPYLFQNYITSQLQIMKPPVGPIWPKAPQRLPGVDFTQPKSQTFYKWHLERGQHPIYEFGYKVHDPKEDNYQEKSETRVGDSVRGYYSVREPNGYTRVVKYSSDGSGFKTQVSHHQVDDDGFSFEMTRRIT